MGGMTVMRMVAVMGHMRVMPRSPGHRIFIGKREKRRCRESVGTLRDGRLSVSDADPSVTDLCGSAVRKHRGQCDTQRYEQRLFLHWARPYWYGRGTVKPFSDG